MPAPCSQQERTEILEGVITRIESDPRSYIVYITDLIYDDTKFALRELRDRREN